jgi:hypothetical protein
MSNFTPTHTSHIVDNVARTAAASRCARFAGMRQLDNPFALPARYVR